MTMHPFSSTPRRPRGFSLVELMVGIVVGMVGLLVVYKTLSVWDTNSRSTVAGGDAQVAGTLATFSIERDIKLAGVGFGTALATTMGCDVVGADSGGRQIDFPMYPVQIQKTAGQPDVINVLAGNSSFFVTSGGFTGSTANTKLLKPKQRTGFRNGDLAIVAGNDTGAVASAQCQLIQVTDTSNADGQTIVHAAGTYFPDAVYSAASAASSAQFNGVPASAPAFTSGTIYNLGPQPTLIRWQVVGSTLRRTDTLQNTPSIDVADGVADMQAEYGVDADNSGTITDAEWTTAVPADWTKVLAVRVALLVRSGQFEKPAAGTNTPITAVAPMWGPTASRVPFAMKNVSGTADAYGATDAVPDNWRYYRYRVYEKVIPLRNIIWGQQ
jgi:type IV pilus assembly protein PilW